VLGVPSASGEDEITKAYRALAAKYHPDKHQGNDLEELAREKLTQLNSAYAVVGNAAVRARYDAARRAGGSGTGSPSPAAARATDPSRTARMVLIAVAVLAVLFFGRGLLPRLGELLFAKWRVTLIVAALIAGIVFLPRVLRAFRKR